ncbi:MAG: citrate synthase/methylcitrate synthase [Crenarchaeota archaeon]|nr:citrate synthase/methylcitrate synthase [Thermoproteota archaeon]
MSLCQHIDGESKKVFWGLEGLYVNETEICYIDNDSGKIYYRGYDLEDLVRNASFEEVAYLLIYGKLPSSVELEEFSRDLRSRRFIDSAVIDLLKMLPSDAYPIDVLRLSIDFYCTRRKFINTGSLKDNYDLAIDLISKLPVVLAYFYRISKGLDVVLPREEFDHPANFYYMMMGREPDPVEYEAVKTIFIIYADHSLANSTFTAITVASTLSDLGSAIVAALSSLKGPLHGGANREVVNMILEIGDESNVEKFVSEKIERKERIMGFGHRVYKSSTRGDPRVPILKEVARKLAEKKGGKYLKVYRIAEKLENEVTSRLGGKGVRPNVDLYAGVLLYLLDIPPDYNPAIFAISRIVGWVAHVLEYWKHNRLIRPLERYIGPIGLRYVPLSERG